NAGSRAWAILILSRDRSPEARARQNRVPRRNSQASERGSYRSGTRAGEKEIDWPTGDRQPKQRRVWVPLRARRTLRPRLRLLKRLEHDVNAVTLDDIKKVSAKYFRDQPYVLATVQPPDPAKATTGKAEKK